jgi:hypothetical protein
MRVTQQKEDVHLSGESDERWQPGKNNGALARAGGCVCVGQVTWQIGMAMFLKDLVKMSISYIGENGNVKW